MNRVNHAKPFTQEKSEEIYVRNRLFYDSLWKRAKIRSPTSFNTWPLVKTLIAGRKRLLEIGPGVRPRLPLEQACFLDLSPEAVSKLKTSGARALLGNAIELPFSAASFDLVCALDIVEHAPGTYALGEIGRVLRRGGLLLVAVPLYSALWTEYDSVVGHHLRYEPGELVEILEQNGLEVLRSATFGILPRNRLLVRTAAWMLSRLRGPAIWFEDRLVLPIAGLLAKRLRLKSGFHTEEDVDGVILLCEKKEAQ